MMHKFSKEGVPFSETDKQLFLEDVRLKCEKNGGEYVFISVSDIIPTQRRMLKFFFVLAEYIAIQNYYPDEPTRTDISATATWITNEFLPEKKHTVFIGGEEKVITSIKSKSKLSHNQMKIFLENIISWAQGQGYVVPHSEDFHIEANRVGQSVAHKNMMQELRTSLQSRT